MYGNLKSPFDLTETDLSLARTRCCSSLTLRLSRNPPLVDALLQILVRSRSLATSPELLLNPCGSAWYSSIMELGLTFTFDCLMMGDEASEEHQRSLAAPFIFFVVLAFQFASHWIDHFKKSGSDKEKETKLRGEIKELLKEASSLSQPSTFAQAAKLKRLAAAKERELAKWRLLSWRTGGVQNSNIMVGIIPWLIVSTRVSRFICRLTYGK
ncbi:hypothetical protein HKD37_09G026148 [Glycine soja]